MWRWLLTWLRPRGGWLTLVILLVTALCLPLSLIESRWLIGASALVGASLMAAWLGHVCGQMPLPGWLVGLFGFLTGLEWNVAARGRLLPSGQFVARELVHTVRWLVAGLRGRWTWDLPLVPLASDVWARTQPLVERLNAWSQAGMEGTVSRDSLVLLLFAGIVVWWACYFAGCLLARGRGALAAFVPLGSAILANVALTHGLGINYLRTFMGGALLLVSLAHFERLQAGWERERIDYSAELRTAVRLTGLGLTTAILLFSLLVPYVTWRQTVDTFWRYAYQPWTQVTRRLDRLFAGRNPVPAARSEGVGSSAGSHSLGGPVHTSDTLVFYVSTSDPPPVLPSEAQFRPEDLPEPPKHYWRTVTYDTYTGQGWLNGEVQRSERSPEDGPADAGFPYTVLTQTFRLRMPPSDLVPAANEPVLVDQPWTVVERAKGDMVGIAAQSQQYTAISHIPAPAVTQLREASADYPPEISARYLALPEIPQRVRDLAAELTVNAQTPYDKVLAVEEHLRSYDYDLEIPAPPPNQDVADYLLFRTRRGYCDYYATAMVVMLRAVGVPARYATGYVLGTYDYGRQAFAVTQRDAHAWVEVYFPGYGWVEFEPTPYRTVFTRPVGGPTPTPWAMSPATRGAPVGTRALNLMVVLVIGVLALGGFFWLVLRMVRAGKTFSSTRLALQLYAGMVRWAERVRLGPRRGETPLEFSMRLGRDVEGRGPWAEGAAQEAALVGQVYVHARYAASPLSARDAGQALTAWEKLRSKLRWIFVWRR